jgi:hypothetical protein
MTALPPDSEFTGSVTEGQFKGSLEDMLAYLRGHLGTDGTVEDLLIPVRQLSLPNGGCAIAQRGPQDITGTVAAAGAICGAPGMTEPEPARLSA